MQEFYKVKDVQKILRISKNKAYGLLHQAYLTGKPFRVVKIGRVYRIEKSSFDTWCRE